MGATTAALIAFFNSKAGAAIVSAIVGAVTGKIHSARKQKKRDQQNQL